MSVSRAAGKLEAALALFDLASAVRDASAVDVGASTGGFTQTLLAHGARHVVAVDVGHGQLAAERCAVMLIAQMKKALGSLDRVERIVKLGAFIASDPHFTEQPKVANGASELMEKAFGEAGRHARAAAGVPVLPLGAAVEVDGIVAGKGD